MQPSIIMYFKPKEQKPPRGQVNDRANSSTTTFTTAAESPRHPAKRRADDEEIQTPSKRQAVASPQASPFINKRNGPLKPATPKTPSSSTTRSEPASQTGPSSSHSNNHPHLSYKFLYPPERRDINRRSPDHPDYNEKTLYVPESFLNSQTPALRQWWLIKQKNMDAILFFKMGKFYELFNEDAVIGVNNLEIMYMKGDETKPAHAGFPEVSYEKYSKMLIEKGYKVLRIEQTETPAMMEERCQETGKKGKFDRVVNREVCRITTKGTQMLGVMESVFHSAKNQYLLAIYESVSNSLAAGEPKSKVYGFSFIDVTIGKLHLGQFIDDNNLSKLNILLAHHTPTEVIHEKGNLSSATMQSLRRTGAIMAQIHPKEFWNIKTALGHLKLKETFLDDSEKTVWPQLLMDLFMEGSSSESLDTLEPKEEYRHALHSFGAIVSYLKSLLILNQVMKCASFELYITPLDRSKSTHSSQAPPMIVDHVALRNLEIFENSVGGTDSTLFNSINYCKTHFGERLLKNWLCSPLCDVKQLNNRLDAIEGLSGNRNISLVNEFVHVLEQTPDLERLLSKVKSQCFKSEGDTRAIMFDGDQHSKAKIKSFLTLLNNFKRLHKFIAFINKTAKNCDSYVLKRLLCFTSEGGLFPDYSDTLDYFENAFNHDQAQKTGKIIPAPGVDKNYDECQATINEIEEKLNEYLDEQKAILRCREVIYHGSGKNRFQIQVPDSHTNRVPNEYRIESTRKGVKRYYTPTIDRLFQKLTTYEEEIKKTLDGIMSTIFEQFCNKIKLWSAAIECMAILDVLQSIAAFVRSLHANGVEVCRPEFKEDMSKPIIDYVEGCHPALVKTSSDYIPNDLVLDDRLILLTGANMGGKSTLMRQTALMAILAQIGCFVPAKKMLLTPVDRIFSRLGASDRLLEGESTFYTELVETSAMLRCATSSSLLLLDELGRGTSTYDGTAIAYSVLREISENIKCRCLFSTHYHTLVRDFEGNDRVRLTHMACQVEKASNFHDDVDLDPLKENITFLYRITEGPVGRSYGFNVAKLAGIEDDIIREAFRKANELELSSKILEELQKLCLSENGIPKRDELQSRVFAAVVTA